MNAQFTLAYPWTEGYNSLFVACFHISMLVSMLPAYYLVSDGASCWLDRYSWLPELCVNIRVRILSYQGLQVLDTFVKITNITVDVV